MSLLPFLPPFLGRIAPGPNDSVYLSVFPALSLLTLCGDGLGNSGGGPAPFTDPGPEPAHCSLPQVFPAPLDDHLRLRE